VQKTGFPDGQICQESVPHFLSKQENKEPCFVRYCHQGMARPGIFDGGDGLQMWRVTANILNKRLRIADKR
jgi:hypothetical protein